MDRASTLETKGGEFESGLEFFFTFIPDSLKILLKL